MDALTAISVGANGALAAVVWLLLRGWRAERRRALGAEKLSQALAAEIEQKRGARKAMRIVHGAMDRLERDHVADMTAVGDRPREG